jgi:hypothetical protein
VSVTFDVLRYAVWLHAITEKMLGYARSAHNHLLYALRERDLGSSGSVFGLAGVVRVWSRGSEAPTSAATGSPSTQPRASLDRNAIFA